MKEISSILVVSMFLVVGFLGMIYVTVLDFIQVGAPF